MSAEDTVEKWFRRDIQNHQLHIIHEGGPDGLVRYLRADRDGSSHYHFNIVTWPGYLSITGDMGSFTFSRTRDMFEFFGEGRINPSYWAEKLQQPGHAQNVAEEFDSDGFQDALKSDLRGWLPGSTHDERKAAIAMARELYESSPENMSEALHAISAAENTHWCEMGRASHPWEEFWDHRLIRYNYSFLWCCHAITWTAKQYRLIKTGRTQADVDRLILKGKV